MVPHVPSTRGPRRPVRRALPVLAAIALAAAVLLPGGAHVAADRAARIFMASPATLDPAVAGDAQSAAVIAQAFEGLTAVDATHTPRPALAQSWELRDKGLTVVFTLRDGLTFSDGTPLTAADVRRSWLRVLDPARPSPLASLLFDVVGAREYAQRTGPADAVGINANGRTLEVRLKVPAGDFATLAASPSLAVVPPVDAPTFHPGSTFVASGGYRIVGTATDGLTLQANPRYWAGAPAISSVTLVSDIAGRSPVDVFSGGQLDWTPVGEYDASWLAYDPTLGPSLRSWADLAVTYYGFETRRKPFDDARVRQAFASAVDWTRIVQLADGATALPATSMVPPGIPGRPDGPFLPAYDPAGARRLLAAAGFADPATFPAVTLVTGGTAYDEAIVTQLRQNLGVTINYETLDFTTLYERLGSADSPDMWAVSWIADYPSPNDFLGILLGSGQPNNYGGWSSPAFDAAIAKATGASDPVAAKAGYDAAEKIVAAEAPVVPVTYGTSSALARDGLLGATSNGLGILRIAGLAWGGQ